MEVLARYVENNVFFEVFDWSCDGAPDDQGRPDPSPQPCQNPGSGVQVRVPVNTTQARCYFRMMQTSAGDWQNMFYFSNISLKLDASATPDLWLNQSQWFNHCAGTWDVVYSRQYNLDQRNCAIYPPCSWWAGIIEVAPREWDPASLPIPALGFDDQAVIVFKAGEPQGLLSPSFTDWLPPGYDWNTFHLTPNDSFSVGEHHDGDSDGTNDPSDTCPMNPLFTATFSNDLDCDGFPNEFDVVGRVRETYLGTSTSKGCASTWIANDEGGSDAWPLDFNDDQMATMVDVTKFSSVFGSMAPGPPYDPRFDLNGDDRINTTDVTIYSAFLGKRCVP